MDGSGSQTADIRSTDGDKEDEHPPHNMAEVVEKLEQRIGDEGLTLDDGLEALGRRSFGPVIAAIGLITLSPIGALPGVPYFTSTLLVLFCAQIVFGSRRIWVPRWITSRSITADQARKGLPRLHRAAEWIDGIVVPRLQIVFGPILDRLMAFLCILLGLAMFIGAFVPFGAGPPALGITLIGLAFVNRDGVLLILGLIAPFLVTLGIFLVV